ncbi:hypothetical protein CSA56_00570 [candidate division KSB3 bacterium]|uniref:Peptidase M50 n=1 Tax=candidate division KSB3 bacterium TaxID=2044937 RepID=A0A2G6KKV9_9BACT|nr:MAG: hypothetical protein CSA56_00570 [candidate division KSB3 bacterium]
MRERLRRIDPRTLGILFVMFLFATVFWNTLLIYPIKLFVVILHEFSHGLAAVLTGGKIVKIEVNQLAGGICSTMGGSRFIVASAGYLGSIFWGGVILMIATRTKRDNVLGIVIGGFLIVLSLLYIRNLFGFLFTVGFGVLLIVISAVAHNNIVDILMKFLGMTSCLYVIIDIKSDLIDRSGIGSDADTIARLLGFPGLSVFIGLVWIVLALIAFIGFLWIASKRDDATV